MNIKIFIYLSLSIFLFYSATNIHAHSGRTDSSGGHNCNVGACAGTYHYHSGGYVPPPTLRRVVQPQFPSNIKGTVYFESETDGEYTVRFVHTDPNPTQYSAVIGKYAGYDPGPIGDFTSNTFVFSNVQPGTWYINTKKEIGGYWSTISYWKVDVPEWIEPTPTFVPQTTTTTYMGSNNSIELLGWVVLAILGFITYVGLLIVKKIYIWLFRS